MKRIICLLTALTVAVTGARADEGMWMLPLLNKMNIKTMQNLGCQLSAEDIYSINNSSLKDAIVQFGGGCTGEIISSEGLLVTNHHCGYSSIQKLSSVEHDYLTDGYWAMSRSEELPAEGLTVTFLESMTDITKTLDKTKAAAMRKFAKEADKDSLLADALSKKEAELASKAREENPHCTVEIVSFYNDNVKYLIVYKEYRDVRFVGAPPSSIGKFGADTDNWMWPRHTGDFSMFRVYADKDNNPADYSPDNVPYTPKNHLKISLKGVQEGDYTMIMGYPGRTNRFYTSPELENLIELQDISIEARTIRQNILMEDMLSDPKIKIQYASKYSSSSNGWKKWIGMKQAFEKLNVIGRAKGEEAAFTEWVNASAKRKAAYGEALEKICRGAEAGSQANKIYRTLAESVYRIELSSSATGTFMRAFNSSVSQDKVTLKAMNSALDAMDAFYKDYSVTTDRKVAKAMLEYYRSHTSEDFWPEGLAEDFGTMDIEAFVDSLFDSSVFTSKEKLSEAVAGKSPEKIFADPAFSVTKSMSGILSGLYGPIGESNDLLTEGRKIYTAGQLEWKAGEPSYPDANFTMRLTYGTVKSYSPADAVLYRHYTTLDGVMEKEDPDNWEFVVPAKLKELWENRDFGEYAMDNGKMPVGFLSNNDITGGNSGSPVLNADGQLIGLAFDGNWESMSSDIMFEPDLQRCINVDIRYVLFIMNKFGGAGYLLEEMDLVR